MMLHVVPSAALVLLLAVGARAGAPLTLSNSIVRASIDGSGGECTLAHTACSVAACHVVPTQLRGHHQLYLSGAGSNAGRLLEPA